MAGYSPDDYRRAAALYSGQPVMSGDPNASDSANLLADQDAALAQQAQVDNAARTAVVPSLPPAYVAPESVMSSPNDNMSVGPASVANPTPSAPAPVAAPDPVPSASLRARMPVQPAAFEPRSAAPAAPAADEAGLDPNNASFWSPQEEAAFQSEIKQSPWYTEFTKKNGGPPTIDDPDYHYRAAWKAGIRPQVYKHDGTYHWSSSLPDGSMLKSERHPTAWMEHFMRATGQDPNDVGVKSPADGDRYIANMRAMDPSGAPVPQQSQIGQGDAPVQQAAPPPAMNAKNYRQQQLGAIDAATAANADASQQTIEAMDRATAAQAEVTARHSNGLRVSQEREKVAFDAYADEQKKTRAEYEDLNKRIASTTIKDRRTGTQKVMGAVAMGLGQMTDQNNLVAGLMQGMNVQTNNADSIQQTLNASIERDLETQRANLANMKDASAAKRTELGMARDFFGDQATAERYWRATRQEQYGNEMTQIASTLNNATQKSALKASGALFVKNATDEKAGIYAQLEAARARAAAAAANRKPDYSRIPRAELEAAIARGQAPAGAEAYLADLDAKQLGNAKTVAEIEKTQRGDTGLPKAEATKALRLYESAAPAVDRLRAAVAQADKQGTNDLPGVGPIAGRAPDWLTSAKGVQLRRDVKLALKAQLRDESGAAISDDELSQYMEDRGMGATSTNADFMAGLKTVVLPEFDAKRDMVRQSAGMQPAGPSVVSMVRPRE